MRILITWAAIVSLSLAPRAKAQVDAFFRGAHLGMTIEECNAYYFPHGGPTGPIGTFGAALDGPTPVKAIADAGSCWHSGAPAGEEKVDFRTQVRIDDETAPRERRVLVTYRTSDHKIVSVTYWNLSGHFSKGDLKKLLKLNQGRGISHLVSHFYDDEEFEVTTAEQYKLENAKR